MALRAPPVFRFPRPQNSGALLVLPSSVWREGLEEIANLEAMKMEYAIFATLDGTVTQVCTRLNDVMQEGQLLMVIGADE